MSNAIKLPRNFVIEVEKVNWQLPSIEECLVPLNDLVRLHNVLYNQRLDNEKLISYR